MNGSSAGTQGRYLNGRHSMKIIKLIPRVETAMQQLLREYDEFATERRLRLANEWKL